MAARQALNLQKVVRFHRPQPEVYEEGGIIQTETTVTIATLISQLDNIGTLMGSVWTLMTSNPLLLLMTSVVLVSIGVGVFHMLKRLARH